MLKPIYDARGWVLASCTVCGVCNYVEPHGTTAECCIGMTEHKPIPQEKRIQDVRGPLVYLNPAGRLPLYDYGTPVRPPRHDR